MITDKQLKPATSLEIIVSLTCKQHRRKEHNWWLTDAPEETVKGPATFNPAIAATFNAMKNFKSRSRMYYCVLALICTRRLCKRPKLQKNKNPTKSATWIEDMYPGRIPLTNSRIALIITRQRRFADAIEDAISFHRGREVSQRASERASARAHTNAVAHLRTHRASASENDAATGRPVQRPGTRHQVAWPVMTGACGIRPQNLLLHPVSSPVTTGERGIRPQNPILISS
jgi:hypothetical protein